MTQQVNSMQQAEAAVAGWKPLPIVLRDGRCFSIEQFPWPVFERLYSKFAGDVLPLALELVNQFAEDELGVEDSAAGALVVRNPGTKEIVNRILSVVQDRLPELLKLPGFIGELIAATPGLTAEDAAQLSVADSLKLATAALRLLVHELAEVGSFFAAALSAAPSASPPAGASASGSAAS